MGKLVKGTSFYLAHQTLYHSLCVCYLVCSYVMLCHDELISLCVGKSCFSYAYALLRSAHPFCARMRTSITSYISSFSSYIVHTQVTHTCIYTISIIHSLLYIYIYIYFRIYTIAYTLLYLAYDTIYYRV